MKKFLAIYNGTPASIAKWNDMPEHELKQRQAKGVKAWYARVEKNHTSIVEVGAPLERTKGITPKGVTDIRNNVCDNAPMAALAGARGRPAWEQSLLRGYVR